MDTQNKYCGNCKHFVDKKVGGYGICESPNMMCGAHRNNKACSLHKMMSSNGWTEITPDNEEEVYDTPPERLVIANIINGLVFYSSYQDMSMSIATMAKYGGYYYYVLPELKIE